MTVAEYNAWRGQHAHRRDHGGLPYVHMEYPKVLYRDGLTVTVKGADEHAARFAQGWRETP